MGYIFNSDKSLVSDINLPLRYRLPSVENLFSLINNGDRVQLSSCEVKTIKKEIKNLSNIINILMTVKSAQLTIKAAMNLKTFDFYT